MANELTKDQATRAEFYNIPAVVRHIRSFHVPRSKLAFGEMVSAGSSLKLDSKEGIALIDCLGQVMFTNHTQQINIMDKTNGKTIASIRR